jgi:hypothetical protein
MKDKTMKYTLLIATLLCAATACSKKDGDAGGRAAVSGPCADAIGKSIAAMTDKVKGRMGGEMAGPMVDRMAKLQGALVNHCSVDKWPDGVIKCFETASSRGDMKKCQEPLTDDQKMALDADVTKLMVGGPTGKHRGSNGGGMMGHNDDDKPAGSAAADPGSAAPPAGSGSAK